MYFDTSYYCKVLFEYLNESNSFRVRALVRRSDAIVSSLWALVEFHSLLHRHLRERAIKRSDARALASRFSEHIEEGLWRLVPVSEALLRRTSALLMSAPNDLFLRTGDAVHLTTANDMGEREVWTTDHHMLAAAPYFGLVGRSD